MTGCGVVVIRTRGAKDAGRALAESPPPLGYIDHQISQLTKSHVASRSGVHDWIRISRVGGGP